MRNSEMGDENENDAEDTSRYEYSGVQLTWLNWKDIVSVSLHAESGLVPTVLGMVKRLAHEILKSPGFS